MPNYRNILKVYKLERELAPDDLALLNTLRGMSDAERELLAEALGPSAKTSKPVVKKLKKCDVCGVSKKAARHRDTSLPEYHEFDGGGKQPGKSIRAAGMATAIRDSLRRGRQAAALNGGVSKVRCTYRDDDDRVDCGEYEDGPVHDRDGGYASYHPFQPLSPAPSAANSSSRRAAAPRTSWQRVQEQGWKVFEV